MASSDDTNDPSFRASIADEFWLINLTRVFITLVGTGTLVTLTTWTLPLAPLAALASAGTMTWVLTQEPSRLFCVKQDEARDVHRNKETVNDNP